MSDGFETDSPLDALSMDEDAPSLPLISLLDIVFILVLFLIVAVNSATLLAPTELPALGGRGAGADLQLSLGLNGELQWAGRSLTLGQLRLRAAELHGRRIQLQAHRRAPLERFLQLSALLKELGVAELQVQSSGQAEKE
ncbi:MAG: biopolymer transporter ExbD [Leptospirales bacterium]|nr:biopolymer transporter ExbD [Leptospirales bacterium]